MGRASPKTRWARTVDGASIAYQDFGAGPLTLVVIHGWVSHVEVYWEWPPFARLMHRLSRNLRVLQFDKRGTGLSDRVSGPLDTLQRREPPVRPTFDWQDRGEGHQPLRGRDAQGV